MSMNDPVLEVLREMRGDLVRVTTEVGRLVRHAEYTNNRLDEHGDLLRAQGQTLRAQEQILERQDRRLQTIDGRLETIDGRLETIDGRLETIDGRLETIDRRIETLDDRVDSVEQQAVATVTALGMLHASVQAILPVLTQGRLRDDRLDARVESCERRLDALEHDESR